MEREQRSKNLFDNDELDDAVTAADDTGMVSSERLITDEPILEATEPEEFEEDDSTKP